MDTDVINRLRMLFMD